MPVREGVQKEIPDIMAYKKREKPLCFMLTASPVSYSIILRRQSKFMRERRFLKCGKKAAIYLWNSAHNFNNYYERVMLRHSDIFALGSVC